MGIDLLGADLQTPRAWAALCVCACAHVYISLRGLIELLGTWGRGLLSPRRSKGRGSKNKGGKRNVSVP